MILRAESLRLIRLVAEAAKSFAWLVREIRYGLLAGLLQMCGNLLPVVISESLFTSSRQIRSAVGGRPVPADFISCKTARSFSPNIFAWSIASDSEASSSAKEARTRKMPSTCKPPRLGREHST